MKAGDFKQQIAGKVREGEMVLRNLQLAICGSDTTPVKEFADKVGLKRRVENYAMTQ